LFLLFGGFGLAFRPEGEAEAILLGASLTRIMFPYLMLLAVSALLMGLCHTLKRFSAPAFGSVLINLTLIGAGGLYWLLNRQALAASVADAGAVRELQVRFAYWLAFAVLIGIALRVAVHVPTLWAAGFRYWPTLELRHPRLVELFRKMPMAVAGVAVAQIMISINKLFATFMADGYVTHLTAANRLTQLPLGILASAIGTAILPQLAQLLQEDRREELRSLFGFALRLVVILFVPASVGLIVLGRPIVALLLERGSWTAAATAGTTWALLFYALGLLSAAALRLVTPLYYARLDLRRPVLAGMAAVGVNVALNLVFWKYTDLGQGGLALATALALTINVALLLLWMRAHVGGALDRRLAETFGKCLGAAGGMALVLWGLLAGFERFAAPLEGFGPRLVFVALALPVGAGVYFALAAALRTPDLRRAVELIRRRDSQTQIP
jgi:putative peptidoglycan lipid II flippase